MKSIETIFVYMANILWIGTEKEMLFVYPDSKVHGANMGPIWVLSAPDGPHFGPMNLVIWACLNENNQFKVLFHMIYWCIFRNNKAPRSGIFHFGINSIVKRPIMPSGIETNCQIVPELTSYIPVMSLTPGT